MKKHCRLLRSIFVLGVSVFPFPGWSQTQLDIGKQTKDVDFSQAGFTRPIKVGTSLPSNCTTGDLFFNSASPEGANLFGCAPAGSWSRLGNNNGSGSSGVSFALDDGTANLYAVTLPGVSGYTDGLQILVLPANSNNAASTLAVSGLQPVAIKTPQGLDTSTPGTIRSGSPADLVYSAADGYFVLTNPAILAQQSVAPGPGLLIDFTQNPPLVSPDPTYICLQPQTCSPAGGQNLSGAAYLTLPISSSDPSACSVGQIYFNTTSATNRTCASANTWSNMGGISAGNGVSLSIIRTLWVSPGGYNGSLSGWYPGAYVTTSSVGSNTGIVGSQYIGMMFLPAGATIQYQFAWPTEWDNTQAVNILFKDYDASEGNTGFYSFDFSIACSASTTVIPAAFGPVLSSGDMTARSTATVLDHTLTGINTTSPSVCAPNELADLKITRNPLTIGSNTVDTIGLLAIGVQYSVK